MLKCCLSVSFICLVLLVVLWEFKGEDVPTLFVTINHITSLSLAASQAFSTAFQPIKLFVCGHPYSCHSEIKTCPASGILVLASYQLWKYKQRAGALLCLRCFRALI